MTRYCINAKISNGSLYLCICNLRLMKFRVCLHFTAKNVILSQFRDCDMYTASKKGEEEKKVDRPKISRK